MNIPYKKGKGGITLTVSVEPRSAKAGIQVIRGDSLKIKLTAPPVDGAANKQLVEVLAKEFRVKKSAITIVRGETSKNKIVYIEGVDSV